MKNFVFKIFVLVLFSFNVDASTNLKWGADLESGAPFSFNDPKNPSQIKGFEYDIVAAISEELGMIPNHVQNSWDGLIPGLQRGDYDIAINGLEITEDRRREVYFTDPYYVTFEQLVVKKDDKTINELIDCRGKRVGTLKFSVAHRMLEKVGGINIATYESEANSYSDLENGRIDAVFIDAPVALYYAKPNPLFKLVGSPLGQISYGIAVKKENKEMIHDLDRALDKLIKSGKLREILERWNLWNPLMATYVNDQTPSRTPPTEYEKFLETVGKSVTLSERLMRYWGFMPLLVQGAWTTLEISITSMALAIVMGLMIALARLYSSPFVSKIVVGYIELIRGTPLLIQLFFIFYGLPSLGIRLSPFIAAVIGLALNYSAYEAENYRAGILAVPKSQLEAALALGMSKFQAIRHIILPQAIKIVIPPVTNDFISLLKDSSLVSAITMVELTKVYGQIASTYFDYFGTGLLVAAIYLLLGLPFVRLARYFERKLAYEKRMKPNKFKEEPLFDQT